MVGDISQIKGAVAIIPAAGIGERMNADKPKQYLKINGRSVLGLTLDKFLSFDPVEVIVIVISPNDKYFQHLANIENDKIIVIDGGDERVDSVHNALRYLFDNGLPDDTPVMIHDAARPCITHEDIEKLYLAYQKFNKACFLASPVIDTLHQVDDEQHVEKPVDRRNIVRALTPQIGKFIDLNEAIKTADEQKLPVTDDVSALLAAGHNVQVVFGRADNIKITHPDDLALAEFYLSKQNS